MPRHLTVRGSARLKMGAVSQLAVSRNHGRNSHRLIFMLRSFATFSVS